MWCIPLWLLTIKFREWSVTAPRNVRIQRIMQRDSISAERAAEWIDAQMTQEEVEQRSDFVITNDGVSDLQQQIDRMLQQFQPAE